MSQVRRKRSDAGKSRKRNQERSVSYTFRLGEVTHAAIIHALEADRLLPNERGQAQGVQPLIVAALSYYLDADVPQSETQHLYAINQKLDRLLATVQQFAQDGAMPRHEAHERMMQAVDEVRAYAQRQAKNNVSMMTFEDE
jgi:hypothetical protein